MRKKVVCTLPATAPNGRQHRKHIPVSADQKTLPNRSTINRNQCPFQTGVPQRGVDVLLEGLHVHEKHKSTTHSKTGEKEVCCRSFLRLTPIVLSDRPRERRHQPSLAVGVCVVNIPSEFPLNTSRNNVHHQLQQVQ